MTTPRQIAAAVLLWTVIWAGCATKPRVKLAPAGPLPEPWALAVYPALFRFPASPYQAYVRGRALAEELSRRSGLAVFGPGEFRIDDPDDDNAQRGTNLMAALKYSKARRPEGLYVVRPIVEQRVTSGAASQTFDQQGRARGGRRGEDEIEVVVRLELMSLVDRKVIAEVEQLARVDPFSEEVEQDPYPEVTRTFPQLAQALLEITKLAQEQPLPDLGLKTLDVPGPALAFAMPGHPSVREELSKLDALEQDSRLLSILRQVDPNADRLRIRILKNAPLGLLVTEAKGPAAAAGLLRDDLLVSVDGDALTGRYVLDRHLGGGRRVTLKVRRAGEELELPFSQE